MKLDWGAGVASWRPDARFSELVKNGSYGMFVQL